MSKTRFAAGTMAALLMTAGLGLVSGQDFPSRPVHIITGSVGGGNDSTSRQIAQGIAGPLGQPVIVENRGAGTLPAELVAKAPPDGHTLLVNGGTLWIRPLLQKVPYDAVRDFSPVSLLVREVNILVVHPSVQVNSVKELLALARARPGELNCGSGPVATQQQFGLALLKSMTGLNIIDVPYKGVAPALTALLGGEIDLTIADPHLVAAHVKSGRLRALAVTSAEPSALAPGLPTVAASGVPGYEMVGLAVIVAPARTPGAIVSRLNQEIVRFLKLPEVRERFLSAGVEVVASSPEQFVAAMAAETAKWGKVIKDAGIKAD